MNINKNDWNKLGLITQYVNCSSAEKTISYLINSFKDNHNKQCRLESNLYLAESENTRLKGRLDALEKKYNEKYSLYGKKGFSSWQEIVSCKKNDDINKLTKKYMINTSYYSDLYISRQF